MAPENDVDQFALLVTQNFGALLELGFELREAIAERVRYSDGETVIEIRCSTPGPEVVVLWRPEAQENEWYSLFELCSLGSGEEAARVSWLQLCSRDRIHRNLKELASIVLTHVMKREFMQQATLDELKKQRDAWGSIPERQQNTAFLRSVADYAWQMKDYEVSSIFYGTMPVGELSASEKERLRLARQRLESSSS